MKLNTFNPPRLNVAKAAVAAAAITTSAAVGATIVAPNAAGVLAVNSEKHALVADIRQLTADVQLAAETNNVVGFYTSGALFDILALFGLGDPVEALKTLVGLIGDETITNAVDEFIDAVLKFGPVDVGRVSGYREVYDRVNALNYSSDAVANLIGLDPSDPLYQEFLNLAGPMVNQRRALLVTESTGGTAAARAMREMIAAVEAGSASWGGDSSDPSTVVPGITGMVALMLRNPSRPSGGIWNLVNPLTSLLGANLMNPSLTEPNFGSVTDKDKQQVLDISFTDIGLKYDWVSDAPNSINPISWLNVLVGAILPTYLIPNVDYLPTAALDLLTGVTPGAVNAGITMFNPTGGAGVELVPGIGPILDALLPPEIKETLAQPGKATYALYDSGNLPLVEPLAVIPRLLGYLGIDVPTPITNALTRILQPLVDAGYNDVQVVYGVDGTPSLVRSTDLSAAATASDSGLPSLIRTGDLAAVPTDLLRSTMTTADAMRMPQIVLNSVLTALEKDILSPEQYTLNIGGVDLTPLWSNAVVLTVAHALRDVVVMIREAINPVFNSIYTALDPFAATLDEIQTTINQTRYDLDNRFRALVGADPIETPNPAPGSQVLRDELDTGSLIPLSVPDPAPAAAVAVSVEAPADDKAPVSAPAEAPAEAPVEAPADDKAPVSVPVSETPAVTVAVDEVPAEDAPAVEAVTIEEPAEEAPVDVAPVEEIDAADVVEDVADPVNDDAPSGIGSTQGTVSDNADTGSRPSGGGDRRGGSGSSDRSDASSGDAA